MFKIHPYEIEAKSDKEIEKVLQIMANEDTALVPSMTRDGWDCRHLRFPTQALHGGDVAISFADHMLVVDDFVSVNLSENVCYSQGSSPLFFRKEEENSIYIDS